MGLLGGPVGVNLLLHVPSRDAWIGIMSIWEENLPIAIARDLALLEVLGSDRTVDGIVNV